MYFERDKIKPDVLVTWPTGCDYPLFRLNMKLWEPLINDVVVGFYDHGVPDYSLFIIENFPQGEFTKSAETGPAWRERAVEKELEKSFAETVIFTEQDFFFKDTRSLKICLEALQRFDTVGIQQGSRLHPCFILTKRELVEKTSKDFSVRGEHKDHFFQFGKEIREVGSFIDLPGLGLFEGRDWYHLSSLTWNLFRIKDNNPSEMHNLADFMVYNYFSRTAKVPQDPRWLAFTYYTESILSSFGKFLNQ